MRIQELKGLIRKGEALAACRVCGIPENKAHFMNLPFYETGAVKKKPHTSKDVELTIKLLREVNRKRYLLLEIYPIRMVRIACVCKLFLMLSMKF